MISVLQIILFIWSIRILANIFSFAYLWYIKEYRFDRMAVHIKTEGVGVIFAPPIRRPPLRLKALILVVGSLLFLFLFYLALPLPPLVAIFIVDALSFAATGIVVFILKVPTAIYHAGIILFAARKIRFHAPMKVVGITGSIGKSSTKEYLSTILSTKYNVLKTFGSQNAIIGIAETIRRDLRPDYAIFVTEMAAYKKGEIASIARLVNPSIGIVTSINEQHLDLFGSLENTMQAKYELIENLRNPAIAIFNADNEYTRKMAEWAQKDGKEVWMYTTGNKTLKIATHMFQASHIKSNLSGLRFVVSALKYKEEITIPLLGEHQVGPVLAAIAGSVACGMSFEDAIGGAQLLQPFRKTMQPIEGIHGSLFIDDSFNNNPQAALAAIRFLIHAKGRKFLVFQPMIELGGYTEKAHREVGELAAKVCDEIILTNNTFAEFFIAGAQAAGFKGGVHVFSSKQSSDFIKSHIKKDDIVLFKGKEAGRVLKLLSNV